MTTEPWRELGQYMSDISELAYHAEWMEDLEYHLWRIVRGGPRSYGQMVLTDEHVGLLKRLSEWAGGWVRLTDDCEYELVALHEWQRLYGAWESERRIEEVSRR